MASAFQPLSIIDLRGGRNGVDPPLSLRPTECVDAVNVDWYGSTVGRKRGGADSLAMTSTTMTGTVSSLFRHVRTTDETLAELWAVDDAATPVINRLAGGTSWAAMTVKDAPTGNGWDVSFATLNGFLFLAYKSAVDRLHLWDTGTLRRAGISSGGVAPTAGDTGSGSVTGLRYERVRFGVAVGSPLVMILTSEPSPSVSFTPSGSGSAVRVTRPTAPGDAEAHWVLEASIDNATFYVISNPTPIATTTIDDTNLTTAINSSNFTLSPETGTFTLQKSYKFLAADQNRLLGFGSWTTTNKQNRIEFSSVVGSLNNGDSERVDTTAGSYIDLDENDSGAATGLIGPVDGNFYAFKYRQFWRLTPSGLPLNPYTQTCLSKHIGCIGPRAMVVAEDEAGRPAVYFMSHRGPYRYGASGLQYLGRGVEDLLLRGAPNSSSVMNLDATHVVCHAVYHADKRQVWFWVATGANNDPDTKLVYSLGRVQGPADSDTPIASGWARHTGPSAAARCSAMFSRTVGAAMSRDLKPYIGQTSAVTTIYMTDSTTTTDATTPFQSYVLGRAYVPWGLGMNGSIDVGWLLASAQVGVSITQTLTANFGADPPRISIISLAPKGNETRVCPKITDAALQGAYVVQPQWGDAMPVAASWSLDAVTLSWKAEEAQ